MHRSRLIMAEHQSPPMWGVTVGPMPIWGCNDWTIAEFPTGASQAPRESRHDSTSNPPWSGSSTEKSGMTPPTESHVIDQTNVLTASCSFEDESYHRSEMESVRHYERVALEANRQLQEL
jgi:hypothetical protein